MFRASSRTTSSTNNRSGVSNAGKEPLGNLPNERKASVSSTSVSRRLRGGSRRLLRSKSEAVRRCKALLGRCCKTRLRPSSYLGVALHALMCDSPLQDMTHLQWSRLDPCNSGWEINSTRTTCEVSLSVSTPGCDFLEWFISVLFNNSLASPVINVVAHAGNDSSSSWARSAS